MSRYKVSDECIGCRACVGVAEDNFGIRNNKAYVKKQPTTKQEEELCSKALEVCPVNAISKTKLKKVKNAEVVLASSNIKETLDRYPVLKDVLMELSPKFKRMQNPVLYNTLARFADFNDAAKVTGLSICEILHTINDYLGTKEELLKMMPECIEENKDEELQSVDITWTEDKELYIYNNDTMEELIERVALLKPGENIIVISREKPDELLKMAKGLEFLFNIEKNREYRISIFNPKKEQPILSRKERKDTFDVLDVRNADRDPFDIIMKKAYEIKEEEGFALVQRFEPYPIINMLSEMGFEYETVKKGESEFWVYFYKKPNNEGEKRLEKKKVDVVIQSATPVAYPIIMRLLQSENLKNTINIKELKVWEETEKHLAWITNKKADISFSAVITAVKLKNSDIKIPGLFVWDNFVLLSKKNISGFKDLIGDKIYLPLFEEAPPAKITKYLIKTEGLNPGDFEFVYGKPFGRPEQIYKDFVESKAETVVLREPEASYAVKIMRDRKEKISVVSYNELWNKANEGFGKFPNAGIVFKGEFVRQHPEAAKMFIDELKKAIVWVRENKKEAAKLSFDIMRQPIDRVELFLEIVNFDYMEGEELIEKVKSYFEVLNKNGIADVKINDELLDMFRLNV